MEDKGKQGEREKTRKNCFRKLQQKKILDFCSSVVCHKHENKNKNTPIETVGNILEMAKIKKMK